jgi:hypothetical protein
MSDWSAEDLDRLKAVADAGVRKGDLKRFAATSPHSLGACITQLSRLRRLGRAADTGGSPNAEFARSLRSSGART